MARRGGLAALALLLLCTWHAQAQLVVTAGGSPEGTYDPCKDPPKKVNKGDGFVFGLAFWPGGTLANWGEVYNATSGAPGLNPCITSEKVVLPDGSTQSYQKYLSERGVIFGSYMVKVDTITAARQTRAEMDQIWEKVLRNADQIPVISVIAFRGENRSEAQYIRSNSTAQTDGTGIVTQLSLLVSWDRGKFNGFQWYDPGPCSSCGGLNTGSCIQTQYEPTYQKYPTDSCATPLDDCKCDKGLNCPSNNCTTTVYVAHRGSDTSGRALQTGYQITQINKFSITSWFWEILDRAFNVLSNAGIGTVGGGVASTVVLEGDTDAALAQGQAAQQAQGQPLAGGS